MRNLITGLAIISLIWLLGLKANAQIEYTPLSPEVEVVCPSDTSGTNYYYLDLNQNGQVDFMIGARHTLRHEFTHTALDEYVVFANSDSLSMLSTKPYFDGDTIGSQNFYKNWEWIYCKVPGVGIIGPWPESGIEANTTSYIGLKLFNNGSYYYGWLKLKADERSFNIIGYAWNKSPGEQIIIGQTQ